MLDIDIAGKTFRTASGDHLHAIERIAFEIEDGDFVCLVGPSGCGKTTTLRLILGLDRSFEGRITLPRGRLAAVFQEPRLLPWRTVRENVQLALSLETSDGRLDDLFSTLGLADVVDLYPSELSLGMARRVALARAFIVQPSLLVLDEPFVSLDDATAERLRKVLIDAWSARPTTVLMVTHNIAEAAQLADRVITLSARPATITGVHEIHTPRDRRSPREISAIVDAIEGSID